MEKQKHVVIIGGGFGGLWAAKAFANKNVSVTLIDRKNHHTFQPLLYQVATAVLSPGEIAVPIRRILHNFKNIRVLLGEAKDIDREGQTVMLDDGSTIGYDYLIIAAGARHSYFGHDNWETSAPGLKTIEDAVEMRSRILLAFEMAEREALLDGTHHQLNFVVVGGGPTGVELSGAIADIARKVLSTDFQLIDTTKTKVMLFEGSDRILGTYTPDLSESAKRQLESLGVEVFLNSFVTDIEQGRVKVGDKWVECDVVLWATGVAASPLGKKLNTEIDKAGRVVVNGDLSLPGSKNVFVIGDMASAKQADGSIAPGVSPAAMQMGTLTAKNILSEIAGGQRKDFVYVDKGSMATIGKSRAIADIKGWKFTGFVAWLMWLFLHVLFLIGFRNRLFVLSGWFWAYLTRERSARLITGTAKDLKSALLFLDKDRAEKFFSEMEKDEAQDQDAKN